MESVVPPGAERPRIPARRSQRPGLAVAPAIRQGYCPASPLACRASTQILCDIHARGSARRGRVPPGVCAYAGWHEPGFFVYFFGRRRPV